MKPAAVKRKTIARWTIGTTNFHAVSRFYQESNVSSNVIDLVARTIFIALLEKSFFLYKIGRRSGNQQLERRRDPLTKGFTPVTGCPRQREPRWSVLGSAGKDSFR